MLAKGASIGNAICERAYDETKQPKLAFRLRFKEWRRPTLAESIKPLPSATLRLTAVFGMGTGRATALWSPEKRSKFKGEPLGVSPANFANSKNSVP